MDWHNDGLWITACSFVWDAAHHSAWQVHFAPTQRGTIAQPQAGVNAKRQQRPQFARGGLADFSQFINRKFAAAVCDHAFALKVAAAFWRFPRIVCQLGFMLHNAENQREQIQMLVVSGRAESAVVQAAGVFLGNFLRYVAQCENVRVLFLHPIGEGLPLKFVLAQGGFAAVRAIG